MDHEILIKKINFYDIGINLLINNQQITIVHVKKILGLYIDESRNLKY